MLHVLDSSPTINLLQSQQNVSSLWCWITKWNGELRVKHAARLGDGSRTVGMEWSGSGALLVWGSAGASSACGSTNWWDDSRTLRLQHSTQQKRTDEPEVMPGGEERPAPSNYCSHNNFTGSLISRTIHWSSRAVLRLARLHGHFITNSRDYKLTKLSTKEQSVQIGSRF